LLDGATMSALPMGVAAQGCKARPDWVLPPFP